MVQRLLLKGMSGEDVLEMQSALALQGFVLGALDGDFGAKTDSAVREFQKSKGLVVDGKAGAVTLAALGLIYMPPKAPDVPKGMRDWNAPGILQPLPAERVAWIDISRWQPGMPDPIAVDRTYDMVMAKCTQGHTIADAYYNSHRASTAKSTMIFAAYHWLNPNQDMLKQADYFLNHAKLKAGDLVPMIDWEEASVLDDLKEIQDMDKFGSRMLSEYGKCILYHGYYAVQSKLQSIKAKHGVQAIQDACAILYKYEPQVAWYGVAAPKVTAPWSKLWGWQWAGSGRVAGVNGDGVDKNWYYGSLAQLKEFCIK